MNKLTQYLTQQKIQEDVKNDIKLYHSKQISLQELKERIKKHGDRFAASMETEAETLNKIKEVVSRLLNEYLNCDTPTLKIMLDLDSKASIIYFFDPEEITENTLN